MRACVRACVVGKGVLLVAGDFRTSHHGNMHARGCTLIQILGHTHVSGHGVKDEENGWKSLQGYFKYTCKSSLYALGIADLFQPMHTSMHFEGHVLLQEQIYSP